MGRREGPASGGPWVPLGEGWGQMCVKARVSLGGVVEGSGYMWADRDGSRSGEQALVDISPGVYVCST